uniref:PWWP domain containing 2A n=1 Tax=Nomascus leucogenys TaxID=61853 RepID=A0A2I3H8P3_NOMLE
MAAVAAEAAATAASPGEGGAGEAEPEMEPIPGSEAGTDPLPVTATEASVPDGETDGQQSAPQADEPPLPPPPPPPGELARSPEAAGPELEAEEKLSVRVAESAAAAFGPHGIPVTVFPKREYKDKPEAMPLQSNTFQEGTEVKCEANGAVPDDPSPVPHPELSLAESLWTSKPPPLFHEGAPYPPPLFIRDTYNQSIPQPPPRKIKRPKRKMYREEPTSIMNAIKLRPRQVLCDKCKNSVVAEKKEIRKGSSASDSSKYEDKKRRNESITTVNKKLKTDHKVDGKNQNESQKRNAVVKVSNIAYSRGRVVKVSAQANTSKAQLSTKKVLQSKNMDHAKAREVLKIAKEKAQKKRNETSTSKNAHSKVHFTRRYQNPSSGSLPPRVRLKPQRYRNEENDSSLKTGLEKMRSGKMAPKPQSRCTSTRSAAQRH